MSEVTDQELFKDEHEGQSVELHSSGPEETQRLGMLLGELSRAGDVILLDGDLGAGKTAFTQGVGVGLRVEGTINSPTFTILKEYAGRLPLYHFDLYRIDDPDEIASLGFEDYLDGEGVCVVEWAERGEMREAPDIAYWPARWLRVRFTRVSRSERVLRLSAAGERGRALLEAFIAAARESAHGPDTKTRGAAPVADGVA